jgi:ElaB/YqjD/DUF883 family membrane-anchored ribosome-binding protein
MAANPLNPDELLKQMTSESVKQGQNLRTTVRDLTLQALQSRELTLAQIKQVVRSVTEGVNMGAVGANIDVEKTISEALGGMDDALLKAAQASQIALQQLTGAGQDYEQSQLKQVLNDLERLEDEFLSTVKQASDSATEEVRKQWASVLKDVKGPQTDTGQQAQQMVEEFGKRVQANVRESRAAAFKATHALTQNFATLASGVLIGLTEGLQQKGGAERDPLEAMEHYKKPATKRTKE